MQASSATYRNGNIIKRRNDIDTKRWDPSDEKTQKYDQTNIPGRTKEVYQPESLYQYIGVCSRSHACANVQLIALGTDPTTPEEFKMLSKTI